MYDVKLVFDVACPVKSYFVIVKKSGEQVGYFKLLADMLGQKLLELKGAGRVSLWIRGKEYRGILESDNDTTDTYVFENISFKKIKEFRGQVLDCCHAIIAMLNREMKALAQDHDAGLEPQTTLTPQDFFKYAWESKL